MSTITPLDRAIAATGLTELARRLGITNRAVLGWRYRGRVPAERVAALVEASEHPLTPADIRPDLAAVFCQCDKDRAA